VILWPDTFHDHFEPDVAWAAVEVLEAAGFAVELPCKPLCCGRPLYDHGMLDRAERQLREILNALREDLRSGVPVVGLEPSCLAVFRDELVNLRPDDEDARRLAGQSFTLAELLEEHAPGFVEDALQALPDRAMVHAHCHHRAVMGVDADERLLARVLPEHRVLDSGCCGMAGAFGYEAGEKHRVSVAVGERVLLPAVRAAGPDTLIVSEGFSCRSQVAQGTGRKALHLAQVLKKALRAR
jgi:Fe-S oxidoreductase